MFHALRTLLERSLRSSGLAKQLEANEIVVHARAALREVCGAQMAGDVRVEFVQRGVLFLTVGSSMVRQELKLKSPEIISALHARVGQERIRELRISVGAVRSISSCG